MGGVLAAATEALLPGMCPHCDQPLTGNDRGLCGTCWSMMLPRVGVYCPRCGGPGDDDVDVCLACTAHAPAQAATAVWGEHDGVLRSAILKLKHGGRDDLAPRLASRLAAELATTEWVAAIDLVTWVPSHSLRRLRRPYSAAMLVSVAVANRLGMPYRKLLARHGIGRQTGQTRARRLMLPRQTFAAAAAARKQNILLIDDVITTGTTLRRAAEVLLVAGAASVRCAALAQTPDSRRIS